MTNRQWNVVAGLAVVLTLFYAGALLVMLFMGRLSVTGFSESVLPVLTAVLGYLARMLGEE